MNISSVSTLADALPLVQPAADTQFIAHLVPMKEANQILQNSMANRFATFSSDDGLIITFFADGKGMHVSCTFLTFCSGLNGLWRRQVLLYVERKEGC